MRFEVQQPGGTPHPLELRLPIAVLGRDPGSDLVLSDIKCSRRHAVIEATEDGLLIRDTESANGVFVNGKRIDRAFLAAGDEILLGDVLLRVLWDAAADVTVTPDGAYREVDLTPAGMAPVPPGPESWGPLYPTAPQPRPAFVRRGTASPGTPVGRIPRPVTVTTLSALWAFSGTVYLIGGPFLAVFSGWSRGLALALAATALFLAAFSAVMAFGLLARRPWARWLQAAVAAMGLLLCPFTLASALVLAYMLRFEAAFHFSVGRETAVLPPSDAQRLRDAAGDLAFALALIALVLLGVVVTGLGAWFVHEGRRAL
jgi:hypothetical protein